MNERIKELEPQCWEHNEFGLNFNYKKFAKLIVQECITVVQNTPKHCAYTTFQESIVDCTIDLSVQSIEQHFSIKGIK